MRGLALLMLCLCASGVENVTPSRSWANAAQDMALSWSEIESQGDQARNGNPSMESRWTVERSKVESGTELTPSSARAIALRQQRFQHAYNGNPSASALDRAEKILGLTRPYSSKDIRVQFHSAALASRSGDIDLDELVEARDLVSAYVELIPPTRPCTGFKAPIARMLRRTLDKVLGFSRCYSALMASLAEACISSKEDARRFLSTHLITPQPHGTCVVASDETHYAHNEALRYGEQHSVAKRKFLEEIVADKALRITTSAKRLAKEHVNSGLRRIMHTASKLDVDDKITFANTILRSMESNNHMTDSQHRAGDKTRGMERRMSRSEKDACRFAHMNSEKRRLVWAASNDAQKTAIIESVAKLGGCAISLDEDRILCGKVAYEASPSVVLALADSLPFIFGDRYIVGPKTQQIGSSHGEMTEGDDVVTTSQYSRIPDCSCPLCHYYGDIYLISYVPISSDVSLFEMYARNHSWWAQHSNYHGHRDMRSRLPRNSQIGSAHGEITESDDVRHVATTILAHCDCPMCSLEDAFTIVSCWPVDRETAHFEILQYGKLWYDTYARWHFGKDLAKDVTRNPRLTELCSSHGEITEGDDLDLVSRLRELGIDPGTVDPRHVEHFAEVVSDMGVVARCHSDPHMAAPILLVYGLRGRKVVDVRFQPREGYHLTCYTRQGRNVAANQNATYALFVAESQLSSAANPTSDMDFMDFAREEPVVTKKEIARPEPIDVPALTWGGSEASPVDELSTTSILESEQREKLWSSSMSEKLGLMSCFLEDAEESGRSRIRDAQRKGFNAMPTIASLNLILEFERERTRLENESMEELAAQIRDSERKWDKAGGRRIGDETKPQDTTGAYHLDDTAASAGNVCWELVNRWDCLKWSYLLPGWQLVVVASLVSIIGSAFTWRAPVALLYIGLHFLAGRMLGRARFVLTVTTTAVAYFTIGSWAFCTLPSLVFSRFHRSKHTKFEWELNYEITSRFTLDGPVSMRLRQHHILAEDDLPPGCRTETYLKFIRGLQLNKAGANDEPMMYWFRSQDCFVHVRRFSLFGYHLNMYWLRRADPLPLMLMEWRSARSAAAIRPGALIPLSERESMIRREVNCVISIMSRHAKEVNVSALQQQAFMGSIAHACLLSVNQMNTMKIYVVVGN